MAAPVVDAPQLAARRLVPVEEGARGPVEGVGQHLGPGVARRLGQLLEAGGQGQELAEAVPAEVVLLEELLDVLGGRAAGAGLEQASAGQQRHDGEHLGAGAELHDGEEVGQVVAEHVAGHRDGVLATADALQGEGGGRLGGHDLDLQAVGVVLGQVPLHHVDQDGVVGPALVEPEDGRRAAGPGPVDGEPHPVADGDLLGLAHPEDVAGRHRLLQHHRAVEVHHPDGAVGGDLEGLVVAAVLLRRLGHQAHVGDRAHGGRVVGAVGPAVVDDHLVDAGVAGVGDDGQGVVLPAVGTPHVTRGADHGRHGGVDDDVARDVEVGDPPVGVDHGQGRAGGQLGVERRPDGVTPGQGVQAGEDGGQPVVRAEPGGGQGLAVHLEGGGEEGLDHVAEDDRVGDLHHGGLEVHREEDVLGLGPGDLDVEEPVEGSDPEHRGVHHLAGQHRHRLPEDHGGAVGGGQLDAERSLGGDHRRGLRGAEVAAVHVGHVGLRPRAPGAHPVGVGLGVVLDRGGGPAVGVPLAEHRVHRAAHHPVVAGPDVALRRRWTGRRGRPGAGSRGPAARRWPSSAAGWRPRRWGA